MWWRLLRVGGTAWRCGRTEPWWLGAITRTGKARFTSAATNVVAVAAGWYHSVALRADGTVLVWGRNAYGIAAPPSGLLNVAGIATGEGHGLVLVNWGVPGFSSLSQQVVGNFGGQAVLSPPVQTALPATYQWYRNGELVAGATNRHLVLAGLPSTAGGNYVLAVTNANGGALSQPINLVVQPQPVTLTAVGAWGDDLLGQTFIPPNVINPRAVAAGTFHSLAMQADGQVVAWGKNTDGQTNVPPALTNAVAVAAGGNHSLALTAEGTVVAWGRNWDGQTNAPASATNLVAIAAGAVHSVALKADGSLLAWGGTNHWQTRVPDVTNEFIAIAAGYYHTLALRADHRVISWGSQNFVPAAASNVVAIAAGWEHSLALRADGVIVAWGDNSYGQCLVPAAATNVIAISAGYGFSLAQRADGTVLAWGTGNYGITNLPAALQNVADFRAGENHVLALVEQGPARFEQLPRAAQSHVNGVAVFAAVVRGTQPLSGHWEQNEAPLTAATNRSLALTALQPGQAGDYVFVVSNSIAGAASAPVALTVSAAPAIITEPRRIYHPPGVPLQISAAGVGAAPLHYQWQFNGAELAETIRIGGTETAELLLYPATDADSGDFSLVLSNAHGMVTSLIARVQITPIIAWGDNAAGQLEIPPGLSNIVAVAAGGEHSLALRSDGSVVVWGDNSRGQTNIPSVVQNIVGVDAGEWHNVALRADGNVIAWGNLTNGPLDYWELGTNGVAVAAGKSHSAVLHGDGVARLWWHSAFSGLPVLQRTATNVIALSVDDAFGFALRADGTLAPWGDTITNDNLIAISAGSGHRLALTTGNELLAWGNNYYGQRNVPAAATNVVMFAAGGDHNVAQRGDGSLLAWGANFSGETDIPAVASDVVSLSAGSTHNLALSKSAGMPPVGLPVSRYGMLGQSALLVASPTTAGTAHYQWQLNGQDLLGATNSSLLLANLNWTNAGNYQVIISNSLGVTTGSPVALTVTRTPLLFATNGVFGPSYSSEFRARLLGASGTGPVVIYASTNLQDWVPIYTNAPVIGAIDFIDPEVEGIVQRYYRATEPEVPATD
jgi:alpha-tubulin suppressor-like RCC1 family protein